MKFASSIGVGEVVICRTKDRSRGETHELLLKVVAVTFNLDGSITCLCRNPVTGNLSPFWESELESDPAFDQEKGCYPEDDDLSMDADYFPEK